MHFLRVELIIFAMDMKDTMISSLMIICLDRYFSLCSSAIYLTENSMRQFIYVPIQAVISDLFRQIISDMLVFRKR